MMSSDMLGDATNQPVKPSEQAQPPEGEVASEEEQPRSVSEEELAELIRGKEVASTLGELIRSQKLVAAYIDARSGGVFFGGPAYVARDVVGRDQKKGSVVNYTRTTFVVGSVSSKDLAKVRAVYIATDSYQRARQILQDQHVLILWGQPRWGKWTTALRLALEFHGDNVFEISPDVDPEGLPKSFSFEAQRGYVIDTLAPEKAEKLNVSLVRRLSEMLRKGQSHLVISADSRVSLPKDTLSSFLVSWEQVPEPRALLDRHLACYLTDPALLAKAQGLSQTDEVQSLLTSHLLPGEVDQLAELLSAAARGELTLEEALARFEAHTETQVQEWFDQHENLGQRTFMIALAVFSGAKDQVVFEADEHLQQLIRPPVVTEGEFVFEELDLKEVRAHLAQGHEDTEYGRSRVNTIVLNNPTFQSAVLSHVWDKYKYSRLSSLLLDWLRSYGVHSNFDVRARAAAAVGELAKYDFGLARERVLLPWAKSQDGRARAAAGLALGIPAWDGEYAPQVLRLLHHWATLKKNWRLQWTAAAAYGSIVGLRFPDAALRDLYVIAETEDGRLYGVISRSVANLFEAGRSAPDYYGKVLDSLLSWTVAKSKLVRLTGLLIFLELATNSRVGPVSDDGPNTWPTLLWLAQEDEGYREIVTTLLRRALAVKPSRKAALDVLRRWLLQADEDTYLQSSVERIVVTLALQGKQRERLIFYLDKWACHPKEPSRSAKHILMALL
ncbi:MAG: hypothetical protein WBW48_07215 [Anaerolineae bacterium]